MSKNKSEDKKVLEGLNALEGYAHVGKVRDSHGLKGELFVMPLAPDLSWTQDLKKFVLKFKAPDEKGKHEEVVRTYHVKSIRPHKKGFIVKPEELNNRNESDLCRGAVFYIQEELLQTKPGEEIFLKEIENFFVLDGEREIGKIVGFGSNGAQDLIQVETNKGVLEIPFVKHFVEKIDWDKKVILMKIPEGLEDI